MDKETEEKIAAFEEEIREVCNKYEANIDYIMEGDTFGIYEDWLGVQFLEPLQEGNRYRAWSELYKLDI